MRIVLLLFCMWAGSAFAQTDTSRVIMLLSDTSRFQTVNWQGDTVYIHAAPFAQWAFGYRVFWKSFGTNFFLDDKKRPLPDKLYIWQYKRL